MTSARSFGNYNLAGAIADLIDNSIKAKATKIFLTCVFNRGDPEIRIRDNGEGMTRDELLSAMRPASSNPTDERAPDDLGRFGWGLKSASFSQCKKLTVLTRKGAQLSGAAWDLDNIDDWRMQTLDADEALEACSPDWQDGEGTEIIWNACDRLSEQGELSEDRFDELVVEARDEIALIFHRYIEGTIEGRPRLGVTLNNTALPARDPFLRKHPATIALPLDREVIGGALICIQAYILPHFSKVSDHDQALLEGNEGLIRNQGFYVYRNGRLIIHGTWFGLVKFGELSQLTRVSIDIPTTLDHIWKITVDKSDAQLPSVLRRRLVQIVNGFRKRSGKVIRRKGGRLDKTGSTPVWQRRARAGEVTYSINREHPLISVLVDDNASKEDTNAIRTALRVIEMEFPVTNFAADAGRVPDAIHQTKSDAAQFRAFVCDALPSLLFQCSGKMNVLVETLRKTEPFNTHWDVVESVLKEQGWSQ